MEFKIGIKDLSQTAKDNISSLPLGKAYEKIRELASAFESYNSLAKDFRLGVDVNIAIKSGKPIKSIEAKKRGMFTEYIIII